MISPLPGARTSSLLWERWVRTIVRFAHFGAFYHHLRDVVAATAVETSLEQARPKLPGYGAGGRSWTVVLDVRVPSIPVAELGAHQASVNSVAWAPHSSCHLCTCSDDCQALIWDLTALPKPVDDPILAYTADAEVNQLQWSTAHQEWVAIAYNTVRRLHV